MDNSSNLPLNIPRILPPTGTPMNTPTDRISNSDLSTSNLITSDDLQTSMDLSMSLSDSLSTSIFGPLEIRDNKDNDNHKQTANNSREILKTSHGLYFGLGQSERSERTDSQCSSERTDSQCSSESVDNKTSEENSNNKTYDNLYSTRDLTQSLNESLGQSLGQSLEASGRIFDLYSINNDNQLTITKEFIDAGPFRDDIKVYISYIVENGFFVAFRWLVKKLEIINDWYGPLLDYMNKSQPRNS